MTLSSLLHGLNIARPLLELILLGVLIRHKIYRQFPFFFLYVGQAVLQTLILSAMHYAPFVTGAQYFYAYVGGLALAAASSFAVFYEIFCYTFVNYPVLQGLGKTLLRWATVLLLLGAMVLAWLAPGSGASQLMSNVDVMMRSVSGLQCGLLILLLLFSRSFGVSWRSRAFGVALGFGIIASANLANYAVRSRIEPTNQTLALNLLTLATAVVYSCSILVWMTYFGLAEPIANSSPRALPAQNLERWNQELRRLWLP